MNAVGRDESESLNFSIFHEFSCAVPPIHYEIRTLRDRFDRFSNRFDISISESIAHSRSTDKRRVSDDEICFWPSGRNRIFITVNRNPGMFIRNRTTGDWMRLGGAPVPVSFRPAGFVADDFLAFVSQNRIAGLDVFRIFQNRFADVFDVAGGSKMPLKITDPENKFGDDGSSRIDFNPSHLTRANGRGIHFKLSVSAKLFERIENFAFEPFQMFESYIKKVSGAAGGIENAKLAEPTVKV